MDHNHNPSHHQVRRVVGGAAYRYRTPAQIIAIIDIVFCILEILGLLAFTMLVTVAPQYLDTKDLKNIPVDKVILVVLIFMTIHLLYTSLHLWMAIRLLSSTYADTPIRDAVNLASSWRTHSVVVLVLSILFFGVVAGLIKDLWYLIKIGFRIGCVYVVHQYITELEDQMAEGGGAGGDGQQQQHRHHQD